MKRRNIHILKSPTYKNKTVLLPIFLLSVTLSSSVLAFSTSHDHHIFSSKLPYGSIKGNKNTFVVGPRFAKKKEEKEIMYDGPSYGDDEDEADFRSLGLTRDLLFAVMDQGWEEPTPIQRLVIPAILDIEEKEEEGEKDSSKSIWSEAPTGSGKTGAFALPLLQIMGKRRRNMIAGDEEDEALSNGKVSTLILCPTRELAVQIGGVFEELSESTSHPADVVLVHGGVPIDPQVQALASRRASGRGIDVLVATPGRLVDVLKMKEKVDPTESALEKRLLAALDATGKNDASLSLNTIQEMKLDRVDDEGRGSISDMLDSVQYLVLDEADRLLGQAFKSEVDAVLQLLPKPPRRRRDETSTVDYEEGANMKTLLFSATFPEQIQPRVEQVLRRLGGNDKPPLRLSCSTSDDLSFFGMQNQGENQENEMSNRRQKRLEQTTQPTSILTGPASTIELRTIKIQERDRTQALRKLIETYGEEKWDRVLVFVSTRYSSEHVSRKLRKANIRSSEIHGKLDQDARTRRLDDFKSGKIRVLIATDLCARGLDVVGLPAVVNYDLPRSTADFTHRIGRTGRAGKRGTAISFVTPNNESHFDLIERRHFGGKMPVEREVLEGFEPDEAKWSIRSQASKASVPGAKHSDMGLAHDKMHGGVKGRRKSKKDKLREAAARKAAAEAKKQNA